MECSDTPPRLVRLRRSARSRGGELMYAVSGPVNKARRQMIAAGVVSGLVVAGGAWWIGSGPTTLDVIEGWASPNAFGSAIGLASSPDAREQEGYIIAGASWKGADNV